MTAFLKGHGIIPRVPLRFFAQNEFYWVRGRARQTGSLGNIRCHDAFHERGNSCAPKMFLSHGGLIFTEEPPNVVVFFRSFALQTYCRPWDRLLIGLSVRSLSKPYVGWDIQLLDHCHTGISESSRYTLTTPPARASPLVLAASAVSGLTQ